MEIVVYPKLLGHRRLRWCQDEAGSIGGTVQSVFPVTNTWRFRWIIWSTKQERYEIGIKEVTIVNNKMKTARAVFQNLFDLTPKKSFRTVAYRNLLAFTR